MFYHHRKSSDLGGRHMAIWPNVHVSNTREKMFFCLVFDFIVDVILTMILWVFKILCLQKIVTQILIAQYLVY